MSSFKEAGFTLIEVLLSLTITFLFASALFSGYRTAISSASQTTWSMQKTADRQRCISEIEAHLKENIKKGTCHIADLTYEWSVTSETLNETVRGFDPEAMKIDYTGRFIITFYIEIKDPQQAPEISLEIMMPA